jgi:phosphoribosyl-ATP pyrophosphohydrolase
MAGNIEFLTQLEGIIDDRLTQKNPNSYVYGLVHSGIDRVLKKIGEEAGEVIIASKNSNPTEILNESADLLFHLLLMLKSQGLNLNQVIEILMNRHDS